MSYGLAPFRLGSFRSCFVSHSVSAQSGSVRIQFLFGFVSLEFRCDFDFSSVSSFGSVVSVRFGSEAAISTIRYIHLDTLAEFLEKFWI